MLYVALAEAAALIVGFVTFGSVLRSVLRQGARERDLLLNQMLNLAGKPWQPAPASEPPEPEPPLAERYVLSPEQLP